MQHRVRLGNISLNAICINPRHCAVVISFNKIDWAVVQRPFRPFLTLFLVLQEALLLVIVLLCYLKTWDDYGVWTSCDYFYYPPIIVLITSSLSLKIRTNYRHRKGLSCYFPTLPLPWRLVTNHLCLAGAIALALLRSLPAVGLTSCKCSKEIVESSILPPLNLLSNYEKAYSLCYIFFQETLCTF